MAASISLPKSRPYGKMWWFYRLSLLCAALYFTPESETSNNGVSVSASPVFSEGSYLSPAYLASYKPATARTLGLSFGDVTRKFDSYMNFRKERSTDGEDLYTAIHSSVTLSLAGNRNDISRASITLTSDGRTSTENYNTLALQSFVRNTLPDYIADALGFISEALRQKGGERKFGQLLLRVEVLKPVRTITVSVYPS